VTVQNRIFFTYLYLDNTTGMTHLKNRMISLLYFSDLLCDAVRMSDFSVDGTMNGEELERR